MSGLQVYSRVKTTIGGDCVLSFAVFAATAQIFALRLAGTVHGTETPSVRFASIPIIVGAAVLPTGNIMNVTLTAFVTAPAFSVTLAPGLTTYCEASTIAGSTQIFWIVGPGAGVTFVPLPLLAV